MTDTTYAARSNLDAERCAIGLALTYRGARPQLVSDLSPSDFYRPAHAHVFEAILELHQGGFEVDERTVADVLTRKRLLDDVGGLAGIVEFTSNLPAATAGSTYSAIVRREASARRADAAFFEARKQLADGGDPSVVADAVEERLRNLDRAGKLPARYWRSTAEYLATDKGEIAVPVIPNVVARASRTLVIAEEKRGKSVLLRQFVKHAAAGLDPFTFKPIEPVACLILDAENDDDELERTLRVIDDLLIAKLGLDVLRPAIFSAPFGMDLRSRRDRAELEEVLEDCRPALIVGGPIYKLTRRRDRESEDDRSAALQGILDDVRKRWGSALILEHHAPTGSKGERELRSKGGQQWDAWTNATIGLYGRADGSLSVRHLHPPRGRVVWPRGFTRGTRPGQWPWEPSWDGSGQKSPEEHLAESREIPADEPIDEPIYEQQERIF